MKIGNVTSSFEAVNGGVPQGTVLDPILFLIMINDLLEEWEDRWKYVDDSSLSETVTRNHESFLQTTLNGIKHWCMCNNMSLNPRKCKDILVCFWKIKPNFPPMTVDGQPTELVKSAKLLGVILSNDLKWNEHVTYIVKKSSKRLYMLRLLKRGRADSKTLLTVYVTCVRSTLEYCAQVWHYSIPEYLSKDIERIQSRALKIINTTLSYSDALAVFDIPTLATRREYLCSSIFNKNVLLQSSPLSNLIQIENSLTYDLQTSNKLPIIKCRTERFRNSFIPSCVKNYNEHR